MENCLAQKLSAGTPAACSLQMLPRFDVVARLLGPRNSFSNPPTHNVVPDGGQIESPTISIETWLHRMKKIETSELTELGLLCSSNLALKDLPVYPM